MSEFRSFEFERLEECDNDTPVFNETGVSVANRIMQEFGFDAAGVEIPERFSEEAFRVNGASYHICTEATFCANGCYWWTDFDRAERRRELDGEAGGVMGLLSRRGGRPLGPGSCIYEGLGSESSAVVTFIDKGDWTLRRWSCVELDAEGAVTEFWDAHEGRDVVLLSVDYHEQVNRVRDPRSPRERLKEAVENLLTLLTMVGWVAVPCFLVACLFVSFVALLRFLL